MLTLIENANMFAPAPLGIGSVLIAGKTILHAGPGLADVDPGLLSQRIDLQGRALIPGLIDCHVHVCLLYTSDAADEYQRV